MTEQQRLNKECLLQENEELRKELDSLRKAISKTGLAYFHYFDNAPLALWVADFSQLIEFLDRLISQGVEDLERYLYEHPDLFQECILKIVILELNQAAKEMIGTSSLEYLNVNLFKVIPPNAYMPFAWHLKEFAHGNRRMTTELPLRTFDGREITVILELTVAPETAGGMSMVIISMQDISRLKHLEASLKRNLYQFKAVLDNAPLGIVVKDENNRYVFVNRWFLERVELTEEDVLGRSTEELFPMDVVRVIVDADEEVWRTREPVSFEFRICLNSNGYIIFLNKFLFLNERGEPYAICTMIQDITKRTLYEEQLRNTYEELKSLLDYSPSAIFIKDLEGKFLVVNRRVCDELDLQESNILGKKITDILPLGKTVEILSREKSVAETGQVVISEEAYNIRNKIQYYDVTRFPLWDLEGNIRGIGGIATEVTERKRLQAEAIRAGQLASLGELAAGVAHEINNPITGVINYAQILKDMDCGPGLSSTLPGKIIKEGMRIADIVRNLLAFARDSKQESTLSDPSQLLKDSLELFGRLMEKDGIKIRFSVAGNVPRILCREREIQQVFLNVMSNARYALNAKFPGRDEGKWLDISMEVVSSEPAMVEICFKDNGIGIPASVQDRIIEPFFSTKPEGQGTGLGLSITYGIIQNHGGALVIESNENEGTNVKILLPVE